MSKNTSTVSGKRSPNWSLLSKMVIPCKNGEQYLVRWRIIQTPLFGVFLHDLNAPDAAGDPHDHPWNFWSIILRGSYVECYYPHPEVSLDYKRYRYWKRWTIHRMTKDQAHRIVLLDRRTKTLIFTGRRSRVWGFFTPTGWVSWKTYEEE